nr:immunoglobulin light chain junction region [Macaca mulatta]
CQMYINSPFAF